MTVNVFGFCGRHENQRLVGQTTPRDPTGEHISNDENSVDRVSPGDKELRLPPKLPDQPGAEVIYNCMPLWAHKTARRDTNPRAGHRNARCGQPTAFTDEGNGFDGS